MKKIFMGAIMFLVAALHADFVIVKDSKPAAQINFIGEPEKTTRERVDLFNSYIKKITGTELATQGDTLENTIEVEISKDVPYNKHYEWNITFPAKNTMRITASEKSIFDALNQILEIGADARFLGVEDSMFQFEPRKTLVMPEKALKSPVGYSVYRSVYSLPIRSVELGIINDNSFKFSHGLPIFAFPAKKYTKGWPKEIMPILKGKKLDRPKNLFAFWQPCYSNPETARQAVANIFEYLKEHPGAQSISLGVNDCFGFCECADCANLDAESRKSIFSNDNAYKSQSYYTWVNRVAGEVCKKYPELRIGLLAYGGSIMPPNFKVHSNVIPMLTLDSVCEALDPKVREKHRKVIDDWGDNAKEIGVWEYAWGNDYVIPRVNFRNQCEFLKYHYLHNGRAYFSERNLVDSIDGPKTYLTARLLKDINADPELLLEDWYIRCAGKEAAPYLKKVFSLCEEYWMSGELKKTPIYKARNYIYMSPKESHLFAVTAGLTRELVKNAAKAHELSEKPGEKKRTEIFLRMMERIDCIASFCGYAFRSPKTGDFPNKKAVLEYYAFLEQELPRLIKQYERVGQYYLNPDFPKDLQDIYIRKKIFNPDVTVYILDGFSKTLAYMQDPEVQSALRKVVQLPEMPASAKKTATVLLNIDTAENYFENAGFKEPEKLVIRSTSPYEITDEIVYQGQKSLKILPANYKGVANPDDDLFKKIPSVTITQKLKQPGIYTVMLKVFTLSKQSPLVDLSLWRSGKNGVNVDWEDLHQVVVPRGQWTTFSQVRKVPKGTESVNIILRMSSFTKDEPIYISDIHLIRLGDINNGPVILPPNTTYKVDSIALSGKSERSELFGKKVIRNNNPEAYSIAQFSFVWNDYNDNDYLDVSTNAAQLPDAKSGKIGAIIYEWKDDTWKVLRNVLWNRSLPKDQFDEVNFRIHAKYLTDSKRYLLIFFKMKNTEGVAFGDVKFKYVSGKKSENKPESDSVFKTRDYPYSKLVLRSGSTIGEVFGKKAVVNRNPNAYSIAHCAFNWKAEKPSDRIDFTMNAAQLPDAESGKIGAIIYDWKDNSWKGKLNVLWNRSLSKEKFTSLKFSATGEQLGDSGRYLLIIFKMKNTGGIAVSDVKMQCTASRD